MTKMVRMYIIVNHTNVDSKQVNKTMINNFLVSPKISVQWMEFSVILQINVRTLKS